MANDPLHVGQLNFPDQSKVLDAFDRIFEREFYTNHGPLVSELDAALSEKLNVGHAISVTNGTVALMATLAALGLKGEVIVPSFTFSATVQSLIWAGLTPVFCDVDPEFHALTPELIEPLITDQTCAILAVHLWGRICDVSGIEKLARKHDLKLVFDAAHAIGSSVDGEFAGTFGDVECFSFHATKVLSGAEGGCITTNDNEIAGLVRTARNFHLGETFASVVPRLNGKMTEAQAAIILLGLEDLEANMSENFSQYQIYQEQLDPVRGLKFIDYNQGQQTNCQYVVLEVDFGERASRSQLIENLRSHDVLARDYFAPAVHHLPYIKEITGSSADLPVTDWLSSSLMQLPIGRQVDEQSVRKICDLIKRFETELS